jgi:hypothetical protein
VGFFEPIPPPAQPTKPHMRKVWEGPAVGVLPGIVALELVLAASDKAVVSITHLEAYPTGFAFGLVMATCGEGVKLGRLLGQHIGEEYEEVDPAPEERLRLGFELADGRKVTAWDAYLADEHPRERGPGLIKRGGSWDPRHGQQRYWAWPLPPPGSLTFAVEWRAAEIALTKQDIDAQPLLEAAARAQELVPDRGDVADLD